MTGLILLAILAPVAASVLAIAGGWRRWTATLTVVSALTVLGSGAVLGSRIAAHQVLVLGGLLRADALSVTMLIVIGVVATLATWASIGYVDAELARGHTDRRGARLYGALTPAFLAAMVVAVPANNIGVIWVAVEATTVITAFLVGHRRTRPALEATWKYVVICSVGIAVAFLGHRAAVLRRPARRRRQHPRAEPRRPARSQPQRSIPPSPDWPADCCSSATAQKRAWSRSTPGWPTRTARRRHRSRR